MKKVLMIDDETPNTDAVVALFEQSEYAAMGACDEPDGESVDIEELHRKLKKVLFSIPLRRYGMSSDEAEELVQEAWLLFLEKRREIRKARPWLTGTVANLCKQEIQRNRRHRESSLGIDEDGVEIPDERPVANADVLAVRQVLGRADERTRKLCTLIGMDGLSYDEASIELGMPLGSVGPLYIRAKQKLRAQLEERN